MVNRLAGKEARAIFLFFDRIVFDPETALSHSARNIGPDAKFLTDVTLLKPGRRRINGFDGLRAAHRPRFLRLPVENHWSDV